MVPWCSGLTCGPVKAEIAGSNPVGTARVVSLSNYIAQPVGVLSQVLKPRIDFIELFAKSVLELKQVGIANYNKELVVINRKQKPRGLFSCEAFVFLASKSVLMRRTEPSCSPMTSILLQPVMLAKPAFGHPSSTDYANLSQSSFERLN